MTHPLEQLAEAVDGTLAPAERAMLVEHLRSCASCRDDVRVAAAARHALRAMPMPNAPDVAAGFAPDLADLTTATSLWSKVVPALAAAAVVAVVAVIVPRLGTPSNDVEMATGPATIEIATGGPVRLQVDGTDYDDGTLGEFATGVTAGLNADSTAATEVGAEGTAASEQRFVGSATRKAVDCLIRAFPRFPGKIVQVRQAMFEGAPAYLAIVLETVQNGAPANAVSIWVAAIEDCSILTIASNRL